MSQFDIVHGNRVIIYYFLINIIYDAIFYFLFVGVLIFISDLIESSRNNPGDSILLDDNKNDNDDPIDYIDVQDLDVVDQETTYDGDNDSIFDSPSYLWVFVTLTLVIVYLLYYYCSDIKISVLSSLAYDKTENVTKYHIMLNSLNNQSFFIEKFKEHTYSSIQFMGIYPSRPILASNVLNMSSDLISSIGKYYSFLINVHYHEKNIIWRLLYPILFGLIFKEVHRIGTSIFRIKNGKSIVFPLFISFAIFYVISWFIEPFIINASKKMIYQADCTTAQDSASISHALVQLYQSQKLSAKHHQLYMMFYYPEPSLHSRLSKLDKCTRKQMKIE